LKPHPPPCALDAVLNLLQCQLSLEHSQQTSNSGQQGNTFYEGCSKDHSTTDVVSSLRLAGDAFSSTTANLANTDASANSGQASTNGATQVAGAYIQQNVHQLHDSED
jgi:hypothetical protein